MNSFRIWLEIYRNKKDCPYWGDSGAGVLPLARNTGRFLVNLRSPHVNEGETYGIFGGGIFLDETPYDSIEQLANSNYPQQHALKELQEETGFSGQMHMIETFVYHDKKKNREGEPCNFYYWNFVGVTPVEFHVNPSRGHEWEVAGSKWVTVSELMTISPQHFGLTSLLSGAKAKLVGMAHRLGFTGKEQYQDEVIDKTIPQPELY